MAPSWCRDDSVAMSAPPQRCSQRKTKSKRGSGGVKGNLNPQPTGVRVTSSRVYSVFLPIFAKTLTSAIRGSTFDRPRTNKTTFWVGPGRRFVRSSALCNGAISKFFLGLFVTAAPYDIFYLRTFVPFRENLALVGTRIKRSAPRTSQTVPGLDTSKA